MPVGTAVLPEMVAMQWGDAPVLIVAVVTVGARDDSATVATVAMA
jgi:hypothetical protein